MLGMTTYILVHGAWCSGWVWDDVAHSLTSMDHRVEVVAQLPSAGIDATTLGDLNADVEHVKAILDATREDVVLVGHSYGGMVLTELADHPSIRHSVYISAFWPKVGQTVIDVRGGGALPEWVHVREDGALQLTDDVAVLRDIFCADLDEPTSMLLHSNLVLQSLSAFVIPAAAPSRAHPTTYVIAEQDKCFPPVGQEQAAQHADRVLRVSAGHMAQVSAPREISRILAAAAGR